MPSNISHGKWASTRATACYGPSKLTPAEDIKRKQPSPSARGSSVPLLEVRSVHSSSLTKPHTTPRIRVPAQHAASCTLGRACCTSRVVLSSFSQVSFSFRALGEYSCAYYSSSRTWYSLRDEPFVELQTLPTHIYVARLRCLFFCREIGAEHPTLVLMFSYIKSRVWVLYLFGHYHFWYKPHPRVC